jgi:molybdopterin-binding protein
MLLQQSSFHVRMICGKQKAGASKNFEGAAGNGRYTSILCYITLSARNRLDGKIEELQVGGVMAHVVIRVGENLIESVITRRSAEEMKLKTGDTVSGVSKSTEVMLEKK